LHAYLQTVEQVFQWLCYISVEKRSMFATELNLHYPANNEGGGQPFVFYSYVCIVHNDLIGSDLDLSISCLEFFPVAFIVILLFATEPNGAAFYAESFGWYKMLKTGIEVVSSVLNPILAASILS
jgi:hypothetical protein